MPKKAQKNKVVKEDFQEDPIEYEEGEVYFMDATSDSVKIGRPRLFKSVEELQDKIDAYFLRCKKDHEVPCATGLALALGCDRKTIINYERQKPFFHTIKRAKLRCEAEIEQRLVGNKLNPSSGIFNLKANYGWVEEFNFNTKNENTNHNTVDQEIKALIENLNKNALLKCTRGGSSGKPSDPKLPESGGETSPDQGASQGQ